MTVMLDPALPIVKVAELPSGTTTQSHGMAILVEIVDPSGAVVRTLDEVIDGSVTLDTASSARARFDMTIGAVEDLVPVSSQSLLAPYGNELRIARGVRFADRIELVQLGIFRIDHSSVSSDGQTVAVSGIDHAGFFSDAKFEAAGQIVADTNADAAILQVLEGGNYPFTYNFFEVTAPIPAVAWNEADDRWEFARGIAQSIGAELYFSRGGVLVLRPIPAASEGNPKAVFAEGQVLLGIERNWDRDGVYNKVIVTGENPSTDQDVDPPRAVRTDDNPLSPTYYEGSFGHKPYWWQSPFVNTIVQAESAAEGVLARSIGAPDALSFEVIVDPARSPSDVVRIERAQLGLAEDHILDSVTIPLNAEGTMSGTTRATQVLV